MSPGQRPVHPIDRINPCPCLPLSTPVKAATLERKMGKAYNLAERFRAHFGGEGCFYRAPGRVNLIGEHIDYNDGFVLPAAIDFDCWLAVSPRPDASLILRSESTKEHHLYFCRHEEEVPSSGVDLAIKGKAIESFDHSPVP